eukprot:761512-Hanusia_phi.AAC.3
MELVRATRGEPGPSAAEADEARLRSQPDHLEPSGAGDGVTAAAAEVAPRRDEHVGDDRAGAGRQREDMPRR